MIFCVVKNIIDLWDPIDLLVFTPTDEYDMESREISSRISSNDSADIIGKIIYDTFKCSFGDAAFNKTLEDCVEIAKQLASQLDN
jgi:hypothetical protein